MIRYAVKLDTLEARFKELSKTWFADAEDALEKLPAEPQEKHFTKLWGKVKDVYIELQKSKCVFCEKPLEGRIEQDVEHFRPKTEVRHWDVPQDLIDDGLEVNQPDNGSSELGYRFLAYHPFNYAAACKNCNSVFKRNLFPIARERKSEAKNPPAVSSERPLLIYPIGDIDDDPEDLITFVGCVPQAAKPDGFDNFRARATIDIFKLDDPVERDVFYKGRARAIENLFFNLEAIHDGGNQSLVRHAKANVERMLRDSEPYANCLRCFHRLYQNSPKAATVEYDAVATLLNTISPPAGD